MQTTRTPYSISFMATVLLLLLFACHSTVANAAVALGATRVIYPANQKQVLLPVTNNDPASVYLIQSWIENAGDQKDTQFVITPPLFSMQGKKENTLRIINATNHQLPETIGIIYSLLRLMFPSVIGCVQTVSRHFVIQTPVTVCQTI